MYIYIYIYTPFLCVCHTLWNRAWHNYQLSSVCCSCCYSLPFPIAVYNCFFVLLLLFSLMFVFVISFSTCSSCLLVLSFNSFPYCMCFLSWKYSCCSTQHLDAIRSANCTCSIQLFTVQQKGISRSFFRMDLAVNLALWRCRFLVQIRLKYVFSSLLHLYNVFLLVFFWQGSP